jgi:hypothetical protein
VGEGAPKGPATPWVLYAHCLFMRPGCGTTSGKQASSPSCGLRQTLTLPQQSHCSLWVPWLCLRLHVGLRPQAGAMSSPTTGGNLMRYLDASPSILLFEQFPRLRFPVAGTPFALLGVTRCGLGWASPGVRPGAHSLRSEFPPDGCLRFMILRLHRCAASGLPGSPSATSLGGRGTPLSLVLNSVGMRCGAFSGKTLPLHGITPGRPGAEPPAVLHCLYSYCGNSA